MFCTDLQKNCRMYHRFCVDKILQKSWQNLAKLGIISQFERRNYENSSAFRVPYGYSIDYLAYADIEDFGLQRGCSIITIKPDGSFDSHIENYYQDKYDFEDRDSAKLEKYHV